MSIHKWCVKHNFGAPLSLGVPATRFEKGMLKIFIIDSIIQIQILVFVKRWSKISYLSDHIILSMGTSWISQYLSTAFS